MHKLTVRDVGCEPPEALVVSVVSSFEMGKQSARCWWDESVKRKEEFFGFKRVFFLWSSCFEGCDLSKESFC